MHPKLKNNEYLEIFCGPQPVNDTKIKTKKSSPPIQNLVRCVEMNSIRRFCVDKYGLNFWKQKKKFSTMFESVRISSKWNKIYS